MVTVYSDDAKLKTEENVPVKEFEYIQQQFDDLSQQLNNNELTPGPATPEGPQNRSAPSGADVPQGPAPPQGVVLIVH